MNREHKSYGYEGGYEDWTADKVVKNMRIMQTGSERDSAGTDIDGSASADISYSQQEEKEFREWDEETKERKRPSNEYEGW